MRFVFFGGGWVSAFFVFIFLLFWFLHSKVLVAAGQLKRKEPESNEDLLLIRAMRDSNVPKVTLEAERIGIKVAKNLYTEQMVIDNIFFYCRKRGPYSRNECTNSVV